MPLYFTEERPPVALAALRQRFAGIPIWFGQCTGHYWAMVGSALVEGCNPADLADQLSNLTRKQPPIGRTVRVPSPGAGPYGPPLMSAAAPSTPSSAPRRGLSGAAAPSPPNRRGRDQWAPIRHRIGSWLAPDYTEFCEKLASEYIHHRPVLTEEMRNGHAMHHTLSALHATGYRVDMEFWSTSESCCPPECAPPGGG